MGEALVLETRPILWEGTHKNLEWTKEHLERIIENTPEEVRLFLTHEEHEETLIGLAKNFKLEERDGKAVIVGDIVIADPTIAEKVKLLHENDSDSYQISPKIEWETGDEERKTARLGHVALVLRGAQGDAAKLSDEDETQPEDETDLDFQPLIERLKEVSTKRLSPEQAKEVIQQVLEVLEEMQQVKKKYPYPYPKAGQKYPYPYPYPQPTSATYPVPRGMGVFKKDLAELVKALEAAKDMKDIKKVVEQIKALLKKYGVAASDDRVAFGIRTPGVEFTGKAPRYRKELFRTGNFVLSLQKDQPPMYLPVDKERLERWVENTKQNRPKVPIFVGHPDPSKGDAEIDKVVGWLDAESLTIEPNENGFLGRD